MKYTCKLSDETRIEKDDEMLKKHPQLFGIPTARALRAVGNVITSVVWRTRARQRYIREMSEMKIY